MVGQLEIEKHMHAHAVYGPTYPFVLPYNLGNFCRLLFVSAENL